MKDRLSRNRGLDSHSVAGAGFGLFLGFGVSVLIILLVRG
jgi:hypothetical protein